MHSSTLLKRRDAADIQAVEKKILGSGDSSRLSDCREFRAWSVRHSEKSDAFRLVSETDRKRILEAGAKYASQTPFTITAFPAKSSAGGLHDFYFQADYFWPTPNDPIGP